MKKFNCYISWFIIFSIFIASGLLNVEPLGMINTNTNNSKLKTASNLLFDTGIVIGDLTPSSIYVIKSGDLDLDSDIDLITCSSDGKILIWKNEGPPGSSSSVWTNYLVGNTDGEALRIDIGDVDNDNDTDIVSIDSGGKNIIIWKNNGTPFIGALWESTWVGDTADTAYAVKLADINGDSYLDVITGDKSTGGTIEIWWNNGTPFLNSPWDHITVGDTVGAIRSLTTCDLDRDNDQDIISGDANSDIIGWKNPSAPGASWNSSKFGDGGGGSPDINSLDAGDLDNDGNIDLVSADIDGGVIVWRNTGIPWTSWNGYEIHNPSLDAFFVEIGDFDDDGLLDIASAHDDGIFYVWKNVGIPWSTWNGYVAVYGASDINTGTINRISATNINDIVVGTNSKLILFSNRLPSLSNGMVTPSSGVMGETSFNYTVLYTSYSNFPLPVYVKIDGTLYSMSKVNPADNNYTDGVLYNYTATFLEANKPHTFQFSAYNATYSAIGDVYPHTGPDVTAPPKSLDIIILAVCILIAGLAIALAIIYHARHRPTPQPASRPRSKPKIIPKTKAP